MSSLSNIFFDDRYRSAKLALALLSIAGMVWCGVRYHPPLRSLWLYMGAPDMYAGQSLITGPHRIITVEPDGFTMEIGGLRESRLFQVRTQDPDVLRRIEPGQQITVKGTFHREGVMTLEAFHVNRGRDLKIIISIIPLLVIPVLLWRVYTISRHPWRIVLRARDTDA